MCSNLHVNRSLTSVSSHTSLAPCVTLNVSARSVTCACNATSGLTPSFTDNFHAHIVPVIDYFSKDATSTFAAALDADEYSNYLTDTSNAVLLYWGGLLVLPVVLFLVTLLRAKASAGGCACASMKSGLGSGGAKESSVATSPSVAVSENEEDKGDKGDKGEKGEKEGKGCKGNKGDKGNKDEKDEKGVKGVKDIKKMKKRTLLKYFRQLIPSVYHPNLHGSKHTADTNRNILKDVLKTHPLFGINPSLTLKDLALKCLYLLLLLSMLSFLLAVSFDIQSPSDDGSCEQHETLGTFLF